KKSGKPRTVSSRYGAVPQHTRKPAPDVARTQRKCGNDIVLHITRLPVNLTRPLGSSILAVTRRVAPLSLTGSEYDRPPCFPPRRGPHPHRTRHQSLDRLLRPLTRRPDRPPGSATAQPRSVAGHSLRPGCAHTAQLGAAAHPGR